MTFVCGIARPLGIFVIAIAWIGKRMDARLKRK
jgi:hypothetical protein